jgi:MFS family permease
MNDENVAILNVETGILTILFQRIVAKLTDLRRRLTMFLGSIMYTIFPLSYSLSDSVNYLYIANTASGFTNAVSSVTYIAYLFDNSNETNLKRDLAFYNLIVGFGILLGSIIGGILYNYMIKFYAPILAINTMLISASVLRLIVSPLFLTLKDKKEI